MQQELVVALKHLQETLSSDSFIGNSFIIKNILKYDHHYEI